MTRTSPPRRRRPGPPRRGRVHDEAYMNIVRSLPCVLLLTATGCKGPIEVDHVGRHGLGQKCSDLETTAMCRKHHRERTDLTGYFSDWTVEQMRDWAEAVILLTQVAVAKIRATGEGLNDKGVPW